jgi:YVTN family beta-propeller protein
MFPAALPQGCCALLFAAIAMLAAAPGWAAPFAYIANIQPGTVSVIDTDGNATVATVAVGGAPFGVAVNNLGTRTYVAGAATLAGIGGVAVIDTTGNTVIATIPLGGNPTAVAVSPDGARLYVTQPFANGVQVVNANTNTLITTVAVEGAWAVAVHPDGSKVYVSTDRFPGTLAVIDTATNTVTANVTVGNIARGVAINRAGTRVYVANQSSNSLSVVDTASNTVVATVPVGNFPYAVAVDPTGSRVYVANNGSSDLSIVDAASNTVSQTVSVAPGYPRGVGFTGAGTQVYVPLSQPNSVAVLGTGCNEVSGVLTVGEGPVGLGVFIGPGGEPPPPPVPLTTHVTGIEVTQAIQDVANSVPLLLDRRTFARVHVRADTAAVEGVTATLSGLGSFTSGGSTVTVPLGPILPSNTGGGRITVYPSPQRAIIDDGFLFELPWQWSNYAGLRLHAQLSTPGGPPQSSCARDVLGAPLLEFRSYTRLKVAFVRMGYQLPAALPNPIPPVTQTSLAEQRGSESFMNRIYPISKLEFAPDTYLFDPSLGLYVARIPIVCQALAAAAQSLCAYYHVSAQLDFLSATSALFDGADVVYALIPQAAAEIGGRFTRGACCSGIVGAGPANDPDYAAHEIGHFLGRQHPVQGAGEGDDNCGHSADDPGYPYFFSFIAPPLSDPNTSLAGFDGGDASLLLNRKFRSPSNHFDVMGYCDPFTWISDYTYRALSISLQALHPGIDSHAGNGMAPTPQRVGPVSTPPQLGDWLMIHGVIAPDLASAALFETHRVDRIYHAPPRPPGNFSIRLVDAGGATLVDYPFAPVALRDAANAGASGSPALGFGHAVPFVAGTREVRIVRLPGGSLLASAALSAHAPVVGSVTAGAPDPVTGLLPLAWTASDSDGDNLRLDILVARSPGDDLRPVQLGLAAAATAVGTLELGGGPVRLRVMAHDGVLTGFADSAEIVLPARPPRPRILTPGAEAHAYLGQVINLEGDAMDPQDGALGGAALAWSTPAGSLGSGPRVSVATLPVGVHVVTLTATDSLGLSATKTISITVAASPLAPGPALTAGPAEIGWHVGPGTPLQQTATVDVDNSGSGNLQFTVSSGAAWLVPSFASGTAPARLTLAANPAGLLAGQILDTTLTLSAVGFPSQVITIPVRLAAGNTFDVGNGPPSLLPDLVLKDGFEANATPISSGRPALPRGN